MTCFYCKGTMKPSTTTYMEDSDNCIVIIKNVPCSKCAQCGEVSYSGATIKRIEAIIAQLKNTPTEIAVINYSTAS